MGEMTFEPVAGGNIKMEINSVVACRRYLDEDPGIREEMWRGNRHKMIEAMSGMAKDLPFRLAITNIKSWKEQEFQPPRRNEDYYWGLPDSDRPVIFRTMVYIKPVEYLEEVPREQNAEHDAGGAQEAPGGVAGGAGDGTDSVDGGGRAADGGAVS